MSPISPYDEALQFIKQNPGTGGAGSLAKLVLSLYNDLCGYSFAECVGNLDDQLTRLALRMVKDYAERGETEDLRAAGKIIADDLYPRLWEMGLAIRDARQATREKWEAAERKAEMDALEAAEAAILTDPAKLIPADKAKELLTQDRLYVYFRNFAGDWQEAKFFARDTVLAAIELEGGAELSDLCPESSRMLAFRMDKRIHYACTDYDAREAYLDSIREQRRPIPRTVSIHPRGRQP